MIGVTGANGSAGRALLELCRARALPAVALVRHPAGTAEMQARRLDFDDPATWSPALDGVRSLYLVAPQGDAEVVGSRVISFLERARQRGVDEVVFCSSRSVVFFDRPLPLHRIEAWLAERSEMGHAILRPSWLMQCFSGPWRPALERGVLSLPAGAGASTWIDAEDVAAAAVAILERPDRWNGKVWTLCGPEPLGVAEALQRIAMIAGVACRYAPASGPEWERAAIDAGEPPERVRHLSRLLQILASDSERPVLADAGRLLGRPPSSIERFARRAFPPSR